MVMSPSRAAILVRMEPGYNAGMDDLLAAALAQLTVLDEKSQAVRLGDFWATRPVVLAFVRHFG
jgi:hypothetical protein